jgi:hypothetical protein
MTSKTSIEVEEDVLELLELVKRERSLSTYSEVLRTVLRESKTLTKSERGSLPRLKSFVREKNEKNERALGSIAGLDPKARPFVREKRDRL